MKLQILETLKNRSREKTSVNGQLWLFESMATPAFTDELALGYVRRKTPRSAAVLRKGQVGRGVSLSGSNETSTKPQGNVPQSWVPFTNVAAPVQVPDCSGNQPGIE
jgi:hypothetical protein